MAMKIAQLLAEQQSTDEAAAYAAGLDCGKNGPTTVNCHFKYFSRLALTQAWERGQAAGSAAHQPHVARMERIARYERALIEIAERTGSDDRSRNLVDIARRALAA